MNATLIRNLTYDIEDDSDFMDNPFAVGDHFAFYLTVTLYQTMSLLSELYFKDVKITTLL